MEEEELSKLKARIENLESMIDNYESLVSKLIGLKEELEIEYELAL
jgi:tetrahydromethanopterin S-methyltransferase subunit G